jgi:hypothetical protein
MLGINLGSHALTFLPAPHQISLTDVFVPGLKTLYGGLENISVLIFGMKKRIPKLT